MLFLDGARNDNYKHLVINYLILVHINGNCIAPPVAGDKVWSSFPNAFSPTSFRTLEVLLNRSWNSNNRIDLSLPF